ncbi:caspase-7-like isoform X2 [Topomyia yanbarensis]|uniref:caspase-7-like isoform X2 n=1 Tax=Topomyia yanbarensis TaxID=2498891 RepID=UPI00273CD439|nr:caspase-7-like isoform X2 [Topomyia yanbarensis]
MQQDKIFPLSLNHIHMDFIDASPTGNENESETRRTEQASAGKQFSKLITEPGPIPRRKGSVYLDTPLNPDSKYYSMNGANRGRVMIYNQVLFDNEDYPERVGSDKDVERLFNTLQRLGFRKNDIHIYEDQSFTEIQRDAILLAADQDLEQADCLIVVILTHGEDGDFVMARDNKYHLYEFIENFTPTALKSMAGKPKLFIVQACRGTKHDRGVQMRVKTLQVDSSGKDMVDSLAKTFTYPEFADLLVVMSSHHGHYSFRNENGSWLIQELCNVLETCDLETTSIYDILTETNDAVSKRISSTDGYGDKKKQIPSFYSTLTKRLFFKSAK